jgi:hypothetical protein
MSRLCVAPISGTSLLYRERSLVSGATQRRERRRSQIAVTMRGGRSVTNDLPTASQLLSLLPVAAFLTSATSRPRSSLVRFQGRPRPFRTMRAKSWRSLWLRVSFTRSRAFTHSALATSHTTAHGTSRPRVQNPLSEGIHPPQRSYRPEFKARLPARPALKTR